MNDAWTYRVFGLTIRSEIELEYLDPVVVETPDITVKKVTSLVRTSHSVDPEFDIQPERQYFHWAAIGAYQIEDPSTIVAQLHDGVPDLLASHALMGIVMSVVLERRGRLCLHASGVVVNGKAALFMGDKGAGKSTTTSAMIKKGHVPISDDLIPVEVSASGDSDPIVYPGFSATKLYPDSIEALGLSEDDADQLIHHTSTKMQKKLSLPVTKDTVPIGALFVLCRSLEVKELRFEQRPAHEALQAVMCFTFKARYGETRLGRQSLIDHMKMCSGLVAKAPVFDLIIPNDLSGLSDLCDAITQKIDSLSFGEE